MTEAGIRRRWTAKLKRRRERKKKEAKRLVAARQRFNHAKNEVAAAVRVLDRHPLASGTLRTRALREAEHFIGVVERGGNNTGPIVDQIIRSNGGAIGEPWCGDFMAFVYRKAGSKGVDRSWASVALVGSDPDVRRQFPPQPGDLVRFNFSHIGMFVRDRGDGTIETIEGNTGSSGAVSDSSAGSDGVKRKIRSKNLVTDYLRVLR